MIVKTNSITYKMALLVPLSWNIIRMSYARVNDDCTSYARIDLGGYK
jgi:hypothetical protein